MGSIFLRFLLDLMVPISLHYFAAFSNNLPSRVKSGVHFQIDIPLKPAAGLTPPNPDFWEFAITANFEGQNKRLLGQDPPRPCIDAV